MFEKYGIRDFFASILKNLKIIIAVVIVFAVLGAGYTIFDSQNKTIEKSDTLYTKVATVYIQLKNPVNPTEQNYFTYVTNAVNSYVTMANTEPAKEYIFSRMRQTFSETEMKKYTMEMPDEIKTKAFYDNMIVSGLGPAPAIKIVSTTINEEFSKKLVEYTAQYMQDEVFKKITYGTVQFVEYVDMTPATLPQSEYIASDIAVSKKTLAVNVALFAILGAILSVCVIFVCTLFHPTINRKSDFEAYGVTVIGEVKNRKGE